MDHDFTWIDCYRAIAQRLLSYKDRRSELIALLSDVYRDIGIPFPKMMSAELPTDIDPFTVFGLFNKGIKHSNRTLLLSKLTGLWGIAAKVPTAFSGIPVLDNRNAVFFPGDRRGPNDIDDLWRLYELALEPDVFRDAALRARFAELFDIVAKYHGNKWKITMGLYWIDPYRYVNLDSCNRQFLEQSSLAERLSELPSGEAYLQLCSDILVALSEHNDTYRSLPELSACAWDSSHPEAGPVLPNVPSDEPQPQNAPTPGADSIGDSGVHTVRYWLYSPGMQASKWDICHQNEAMLIGWSDLGDLTRYATRGDMRSAMRTFYGSGSSHTVSSLATWEFVHGMNEGDIIFVKKGRRKIIGRGVVQGQYRFDPSFDDEFKNLRPVKWTHVGEWEYMGSAAMKTLTDITRYTESVEKLNALFESEEDDGNDTPVAPLPLSRYTSEDFLSEVFMSRDAYTALVEVLEHRKNIILEGAPGVGKTYAAKRLAYSVMGVKDPERVMMVQFHQSYSYEDLIEGYRPSGDGFTIKKGAFYKFCRKAQDDPDNAYFFIIDEINRGNLSRIFGELFMLIEADKRGVELRLLYSDEQFSVPPNVYVIGMMNTADRSLALMDYALRRRFSFIPLVPGFDTAGFRAYQRSLGSACFDRLVESVLRLNRQIAEDPTLGPGFCIGHSYLCNQSADDRLAHRLRSIVEYDLIPLLREYWFDEPDKVALWSEELRGAVQ